MARPRTKNKDNARRSKKRTSILTQEKVTYVDYKDVNLLRRFQSDRAKIRARRVTGNSSQQQAEVAMAIKNAREMALLPYTSRVTQQRGGRGRDGDRRGRDDDRRRDDDRGREEAEETTAETAGDAPEAETSEAPAEAQRTEAPGSETPATEAQGTEEDTE